MYLQELKILYKSEINEEKKKHIKILIEEKVKQSRIQWFIKKEEIKREPDLFSRMLAEVEGIQNIDLNKIEKPFDTNTYNMNVPKKKLGMRHDF
jgi:hypothetical protein